MHGRGHHGSRGGAALAPVCPALARGHVRICVSAVHRSRALKRICHGSLKGHGHVLAHAQQPVATGNFPHA